MLSVPPSGIEDRLSALGEWLQERFARLASRGSLPQGFVSASLLFCVGPMAYSARCAMDCTVISSSWD